MQRPKLKPRRVTGTGEETEKSLGVAVSPGAVGVVLVSVEGERERQEGEKRISCMEEWEGERGSA